MYEDPRAFLGVQTPLEQAGAVILPVPYEQTTSYGKGTVAGPAAILAASLQVEFYDPDLDRELDEGIHTLPPYLPPLEGPRQAIRALREVCLPHLEAGRFLLTLGGEHTLTLGPLMACKEIWPELGVVQIDAHADLRDTYQGTNLSHACVMRRAREMAPLLQLGIRAYSREEALYALDHDLQLFSPEAVREDQSWRETLAALPDRIYLTVDLDGLDPSLVPGVGTPEPGGLAWKEVLEIVSIVFEEKTVVAADLVELAPIPGQPTSDVVAARLAHRLLLHALS